MCVFFQAEDGIRYLVRSRGLGDVYKRQAQAMGYVIDATKADTVKFPKRAGEAGANQFCHNLSLIHI